MSSPKGWTAEEIERLRAIGEMREMRDYYMGRSAGAAPVDEEPLEEVAHILAHYAIEDVDWEALRPFIRSAGAAPLDVEALAESMAATGFEGHPVDTVNWAREIAAEYARLLDAALRLSPHEG